MNRWFRFYDSVLDDPKVQRLPDAVFRAWVNLMCLASRCEGRIAKNWDDISFALRTNIEAAKIILGTLLASGLIEEKKHWYEPHNWRKRQYKSDTSTSRVKRFRQRFKTVSETPPEQTQTRAEQKQIPSASRFDEFWLVCPRKIGKGAAEKAWGKAIKDSDPQHLIDKMRGFAGECAGKDQNYIPHPATWLNAKRWMDETKQSLEPAVELSPERLAELQDRTDKAMGRGKYAPNYK